MSVRIANKATSTAPLDNEGQFVCDQAVEDRRAQGQGADRRAGTPGFAAARPSTALGII